MISNYHTASGGEQNYYYSGFGDNDDEGGAGAGAATASKGTKKSKSSPGKNKRSPNRRGLFGRKLKQPPQPRTPTRPLSKQQQQYRSDTSSMDSNSISHDGGVSLSYSAGSSVQSAGESTDSSQFDGILKVLELEDSNALTKLEKKLMTSKNNKNNLNAAAALSTNKSIHSANSSLNYSDTDGELSQVSRGMVRGYSSRSNYSTDYSTDQESALEGSRLMEVLMQDEMKTAEQSSSQQQKQNPRLLGEEVEEEEPMGMLFEEARSPKTKSSTSSTTPTTTATTNSTTTSGKAATATTSSRTTASTTTTTTTTTTMKNNSMTRTESRSSFTRTSPTSASGGAPVPVGQHRGAKAKNNNHNNNNNDKNSTGFEQMWSCGADLIDDVIPARVKTVLRPYLCGVL